MAGNAGISLNLPNFFQSTQLGTDAFHSASFEWSTVADNERTLELIRRKFALYNVKSYREFVFLRDSFSSATYLPLITATPFVLHDTRDIL